MLRVRESSASRYNALLLDLIVHLILQRVSPVNAWRMPGTREGGRAGGGRRLAHFGTDAQKGVCEDPPAASRPTLSVIVEQA